MASKRPEHVDTVIIGNGPSALILSYILHGHIPYYAGGHHDPILDSKLRARPSLLSITPDLYAHFQSSLRYSTQALPINTLLDTLLRPNADTEVNPASCVEWRFEPDREVSHVALGKTAQAGGQWADSPVSASWDIGTLSYAEMLSLPGQSYNQHYNDNHTDPLPDFVRPTRTEVSSYFSAYPAAVGISDSIRNSVQVKDIVRTQNGFFIGSHNIHCKHLVLASGIFDVNIPPPPLLAPITNLNSLNEPLLVVGSGFSAADIIISTPPNRKILHLFQWAPEQRPSPLRGCHHQAYPEYAGIYRQMKLAALNSSKSKPAVSPFLKRKKNSYFSSRDWSNVYEGFPNAEVLTVVIQDSKTFLKIRLESGKEIERVVGGLEYVVGRRGNLDYLSPPLRNELLGHPDTVSSFDKPFTSQEDSTSSLISGRTLRERVAENFEVAPSVFVIGSLAGDSLVRHAFGGCVYVAGKIIESNQILACSIDADGLQSVGMSSSRCTSLASSPGSSPDILARKPANDALNGFAALALTPPHSRTSSESQARGKQPLSPPNGKTVTPRNGAAHEDLHLDRRKLAREIEVQDALNRAWQDTGWWGAPRWGL